MQDRTGGSYRPYAPTHGPGDGPIKAWLIGGYPHPPRFPVTAPSGKPYWPES